VLDVGGVATSSPEPPRPSGRRRGRRVVVGRTCNVREDALQLYGFAERAERELFIQL